MAARGQKSSSLRLVASGSSWLSWSSQAWPRRHAPSPLAGSLRFVLLLPKPRVLHRPPSCPADHGAGVGPSTHSHISAKIIVWTNAALGSSFTRAIVVESSNHEDISMARLRSVFVSVTIAFAGCTPESTEVSTSSAALKVKPAEDACTSTLSRELSAAFNDEPGFAGIYLGEDGRSATVLHTARIHPEQLIEPSRRLLATVTQAVYDGERVAVVPMKDANLIFKRVDFSLARLIEAEEALCRQVADHELQAEVRVDYLENRIVVAGDVEVSGEFEELIVRRAYRPFEPTSNVRDYRRPIVAGAQCLYAGVNSSTETCTIGFVASFSGTLRYITASHCSPQLFSVPGFAPPELRQNGWTLFDGVGTEVLDPGPNCGTKCRRTDATVSSVAFPGQTTFGSVLVPTQLSGIVNPACVNNGSCTQTTVGNILPLQSGGNLLPGSNVERIGRTSGRVFGTFTGLIVTPISISSSRHGTYSVGRHGRVVVSSGVSWTTGSNLAVPGDSGGPVLRWTGSGFVPDGIVFASRVGFAPFDPPDYQFSTLSDLVTDLGNFTVF